MIGGFLESEKEKEGRLIKIRDSNKMKRLTKLKVKYKQPRSICSLLFPYLSLCQLIQINLCMCVCVYRKVTMRLNQNQLAIRGNMMNGRLNGTAALGQKRPIKERHNRTLSKACVGSFQELLIRTTVAFFT